MPAPDFDITALANGIEGCRKNIAIFEKAIEKERSTIAEYRRQIEVLANKKHVADVASRPLRIEVERDGD
jgi:hypothetical protein